MTQRLAISLRTGVRMPMIGAGMPCRWQLLPPVRSGVAV
jgi:hypothetical protein